MLRHSKVIDGTDRQIHGHTERQTHSQTDSMKALPSHIHMW